MEEGRGWERKKAERGKNKILLHLAPHGVQKTVHALCILLHFSRVFKALAYMEGRYKFIFFLFSASPSKEKVGHGWQCILSKLCARFLDDGHYCRIDSWMSVLLLLFFCVCVRVCVCVCCCSAINWFLWVSFKLAVEYECMKLKNKKIKNTNASL